MNTHTVKALFFYAPGCVFCPQVHHVLEQLLAEQQLDSLDAINIAEDTRLAEQLGVRSVPWLKLNDIVLFGQHSEAELQRWVELSRQGTANEHFILEQLESGQLQPVEDLLARAPGVIQLFLKYLPDMSQSINVRLGISALLEGLQGTELLASIINDLGTLTQSEDVQVRADACHYLGLSQRTSARSFLQAALEDENHEVREIAEESLTMLSEQA